MTTDLFGQRPLYVEPGSGARSPSALALSPAGLDPAVAASVLAGTLDPSLSLFLGLRRVPPLRPSERPLRAFGPRLPAGPQEDERAAAELLATLESALVGQAPPGPVDVTSSGGLDSSVLTALLASAARAGRAFTLVADYDVSDDVARAATLCSSLGVEQVTVELGEAELPDRFEAAVLAAEAPLWNGKAVASLLFFERCRAAGAGTLVSGCGADEVLCGQPGAMSACDERAALERRMAAAILLPAVRARLGPLPPRAQRSDLLEDQSRLIETVLPESTLVPECRLSAAAGVVVRLPYLDATFARLALSLPIGQRARDGFGKWLLRVAAQGLLPPATCWRRKQPRLAPAGGASQPARARWRALLDAWLASGRLARLGLVDARAVRALFERHVAGATAAAEATAADALLLRLASLCILQAAVDRAPGLADARRGEEA